jgi:nucleotide-binding universal stress UspA family protein
MKIKKILAGVAFDKETDRILAYTTLFAKAFDASVKLLFVMDYLVTPPTYLIPYLEEEKKIAEINFDILKKRLKEENIQAVTELMVGRLQESFETASKKTNADLLVLGFMSHAFRRSSSEKLIKGLQMPMLVVRGEKAENAQPGPVKIKRVLCPVDFSEISGNALTVAKAIRDIFSAKLDILYVIPDLVIKKIEASGERDRVVHELRIKAEETFNTFLGDAGLTEKGMADQGEPYKRIVTYADENDIDLIVMGARGLGLIRGMLIGSVTDAVLKSSPCPVLVIH